MKITSTFIPLVATASTLVSAGGLSFFGSGQAPMRVASSIPGDSPLDHCRPAHDNDILDLKYVKLTPNPPVPGQNLTIEAVGTFKEDVEEGAYVNLQVKYGLIRLVNTQADLCEQVQNVDMSCPLKEGETRVRKDVAIPAQVPPGKYGVVADVFNSKDEPIICLTAQIEFPRG